VRFTLFGTQKNEFFAFSSPISRGEIYAKPSASGPDASLEITYPEETTKKQRPVSFALSVEVVR